MSVLLYSTKNYLSSSKPKYVILSLYRDVDKQHNKLREMIECQIWDVVCRKTTLSTNWN